MSTPKVSVIGSCRVHQPLAAAENQGLVTLRNEGLTSYSHSIKEAIQKLRHSNRKIEYPKHLEAYINGKARDGNHQLPSSSYLKETDCYVVEISSKKRLVVEGFCIQQNFFQDYFVKPNNLQDWWSDLVRLTNESGKARVSPKAEWISDDVRAIASAAILSLDTAEQIQEDMATISRYVNRPVLFAGHFDVPREDGRPLKERIALNEALAKGASAIGAGYFEPSSLINEFGQSTALREGSTNHWHHDFESVVGRRIADQLLNLCITARQHPSDP